MPAFPFPFLLIHTSWTARSFLFASNASLVFFTTLSANQIAVMQTITLPSMITVQRP